tara:strand:- start:1501 stop:2904 length:1404 start_codon:yes stop_codon:yes gene_type:complete
MMRGEHDSEIKQVSFSVIVFVCCISLFLISTTSSYGIVTRRTAIVEVVEKVGPAVVNINTEEIVPQRANPFYGFGDPFFDEFFNVFRPPRNFRRQSLGSGVAINSSGYILTNEHVISRASSITVTLIDKREFSAKLIGADPKSDIAVIKIDSNEPLPFIEMGSSDNLLIGETVVAIGNPFGLSHTVTTGIISALNRNIKAGKSRIFSDFIQLDASINPGNSGGPLLNIKGELIGVNTAIFKKGEGIGFAIPINKAKRIVDDLISYGEVHQGWFGIFVQQLTSDLADVFGTPGLKGVLITKVFAEGPADEAGLFNGDIIQAIGGTAVTSPDDFQNQISSYTAGEHVTIDFIRNKKEKTVKLLTIPIPENLAEELAKGWLGLQVDEINNDMISKYNLFTSNGVVITKLNPHSAAAKLGILNGDVIRQINKQTIKGIPDFRKAVIEAMKRKSVLFLVQRGRYGYYVTVEP